MARVHAQGDPTGLFGLPQGNRVYQIIGVDWFIRVGDPGFHALDDSGLHFGMPGLGRVGNVISCQGRQDQAERGQSVLREKVASLRGKQARHTRHQGQPASFFGRFLSLARALLCLRPIFANK